MPRSIESDRQMNTVLNDPLSYTSRELKNKHEQYLFLTH